MEENENKTVPTEEEQNDSFTAELTAMKEKNNELAEENAKLREQNTRILKEFTRSCVPSAEQEEVDEFAFLDKIFKNKKE